MYDRRSGHSAKNRRRDDPNELKRAGRLTTVVVVPPSGFCGAVVVVDLVVLVVVEGGGGVESVGEDCASSPRHPLNASVATATIAAIGSARVMWIRRVPAPIWFRLAPIDSISARVPPG
jgi:hypothetical protein